VSLAEELGAELGPEPGAKRPAQRSGDLHPAWTEANRIETVRVLDLLGIEHDDKFAKCPGCGEEGAKLCTNGGIKCLHARCSGAGPRANPGFRTNIDLAAHARNVDAFDAALWLCERFGISVPAKAQSGTRQRAGEAYDDADYTPEPPEGMREPGWDEDEPAEQAQPAPPQAAKDAPRLLSYHDLITASAERALTREDRVICTTGHWRLDDVTGGFKPGFVWVFGADSSWGKSSFLVMLADENVRRNKRVLIVSGEDDESLYGDRLLIRRARVSAERFLKRRLWPEEIQRVQDTKRKAEPLPVYLDGRGRSIERLCRQLEAIVREQEIDLVALDYVQAFDNEQRQQDKRNTVTYIARRFTDTIKAAGKSGIIFSQITKSAMAAKPNPDKHSIRDSRDVSNAAEVIVLGFEPEKAITQNNTLLVGAGQKCVLVDKCKDGPRGALIPMVWDSASACFNAVEHPETTRIAAIATQYGHFQDGM